MVDTRQSWLEYKNSLFDIRSIEGKQALQFLALATHFINNTIIGDCGDYSSGLHSQMMT